MLKFFFIPVSHHHHHPHRRWPRPTYTYTIPGGSYTGRRCDAPYGPSGPAAGCPWN